MRDHIEVIIINNLTWPKGLPMPQQIKSYTKRRSADGHHCRMIAYDNALYAVHPEALLLLRLQGRELVVAEGKMVRGFSIREESERVYAHLDWEVKLKQPAAAIADTDGGVLVAWNVDDYSVLALVDRKGLSDVVKVSGAVSALTASHM